jgi:SAM-dependent methyltransferase
VVAKRYDRAYFDKWYRHPQHRVATAAELRRKITMVTAVTEYVLGRSLRSVLDVGCGEGRWQPVLQRLRPGSGYAGVDASEYAVGRWGRRRNLRRGCADRLDELGLSGPFDLVVCCDVLHYLDAAALGRTAEAIADRVHGVAYLETYTRSDEIDGDLESFRRRPAGAYRDAFARVGLVAIGLHCWAPGARARELAALACP